MAVEILYSRFNFLLPVSVNDTFITIADVNGTKRHSITPSNVTSTYAIGFIVYIKSLGTDKIIELKFSLANEAYIALQMLQQALDKFGQSGNQQGNLSDADKIYIKNTINTEIGNTKFAGHYTTSMTWSVAHNFGSVSQFYTNNQNHRPAVNLIDDEGNEMEGFVEYNNVNSLTIYFNRGVSGWIYLN